MRFPNEAVFSGTTLAEKVIRQASTMELKWHFLFSTHFHPYACNFIERLARDGLDGLLAFDTQTLGNAYLHEPWRPGYEIATAGGPSVTFIHDSGDISNPLAQGQFYALVTDGNELKLYSHDNSSSANAWSQVGQTIVSQVVGPGAFARVEKANTPQLHALAQRDDGLWHYMINPANAQVLGAPVRVSADARAGGSLIQSDFGNLEAVILEPGGLSHFWYDGSIWRSAGVLAPNATGPGALIQSSFRLGNNGNFEVIVPEGKRLVHYWKDNKNNMWSNEGTVVTDSLWEPGDSKVEGYPVGPGSFIQSRIRDGWQGNYEIVVREGKQGQDLVHYWKDNSTPNGPWHRGQVITTRASSPGSIVHGPWSGDIGNFEVMVGQNNRVAHYWHVNMGDRFYFKSAYSPVFGVVDDPFPRHEVDFSPSGAYSIYNQEIFFHIPHLLATTLADNGRFDEATRWFHYVFDPTTDIKESGTSRFWKYLPFRGTERQRIDDFLQELGTNPDATTQVKDWQKHPFDPFRIANLRPIAYQKHVVMKYLDHRIAKAEGQFRNARSLEDINAATQGFVMAKNILGAAAQRVPRRGKTAARSFAELQDLGLDALSNAIVALENEVPFSSLGATPAAADTARLLGMGHSLFFCVPKNDKLLGYWDTVDDRLFKLRHCLSIEGVPLDLPLFEPPIDPALLVQAAAKGLDIGTVLADLSAPLPKYRFNYILQKAIEFCADVRAYGAALLAAIEKREAETIATIRASHEVEMLKRIVSIKELQIKEATSAREALENTRAAVDIRIKFYEANLKENGTGLSLYETLQSKESGWAQEDRDAEHESRHLASTFALIPELATGIAASISFGGRELSGAQSLWADRFSNRASLHMHHADDAGRMGSYERRARDWQLQLDLANNEQKQIDKQILASQIREQIAERDLENQNKQVEAAQEIREYLQGKFTNAELYSWMQAETASVFFQAYRLAYDLAKQAERGFRFERGVTSSDFIQFGYWDNLHSGLMAGERLHLALKLMEKAYLDQNRRDFEISKDISLLRLDPIALIALKETGKCEVSLPELLFDTDYPGHYLRRVKSASITIPCVVGPYTGVNCTLTLLHSTIRKDPLVGKGYAENSEEDDPRFLHDFAAVQSIATSHAQNDAGMFELNFRDERYLPFEGAGAVSRWRIDLPKDCNGFDFDTISDLVLKLSYTARDGGAVLAEAAGKWHNHLLEKADPAQARLVSARHEFPNEWQRFLHPVSETDPEQVLEINLDPDRFPFLFRGKQIQITTLHAYIKPSDKPVKSGSSDTFASLYTKPNAAPLEATAKFQDKQGETKITYTFKSVQANLQGLPYDEHELSGRLPGTIRISIDQLQLGALSPDFLAQNASALKRLVPDAFEDLVLVLEYGVQ